MKWLREKHACCLYVLPWPLHNHLVHRLPSALRSLTDYVKNATASPPSRPWRVLSCLSFVCQAMLFQQANAGCTKKSYGCIVLFLCVCFHSFCRVVIRYIIIIVSYHTFFSFVLLASRLISYVYWPPVVLSFCLDEIIMDGRIGSDRIGSNDGSNDGTDRRDESTERTTGAWGVGRGWRPESCSFTATWPTWSCTPTSTC